MLQSKGKGGSSRAKAERQETRPFVADTIQASRTTIPAGAVPSQARPTPLPKPAVNLKSVRPPKSERPGKSRREMSLLGLAVPRFARKVPAHAPEAEPRADSTQEISDADVSVVPSSSSTAELSVSDLRADRTRDNPPPLPRFPLRRQSPWLVWSLVGGAWCVMIALALLAVDDDGKAATGLRAERVTTPALVGSVSAAPSANAGLSLSAPSRVSSESARETDKTAASNQAASASSTPEIVAAPINGVDAAKEQTHTGEKRLHKRADRRAKAHLSKKKRSKRSTHAVRTHAERG